MEQEIKLDEDGFLLDHQQWNETIARKIAHHESIELNQHHWEIIYLVQAFYKRYEHSPEMRPLVKFTKQELGEEKGNSLYLLSLFPNSPAKLACKIAGLPRPANCL